MTTVARAGFCSCGEMLPAVGDVPIVPALWDTPWMFRMRQRKADDFDEGRAADSVLGETASRFGRRFRAAVSPRGSIGKIRLSLSAYSGTQFPLEARLGNRGPFRPPIPGCAFRYRPQPESASRFDASEWDAVSPRGPIGKSETGIRLSSGIQFPQQARLGNHGPEFPLHQSAD